VNVHQPVVVFFGGGVTAQKWFLLELIKIKITTQVTVSVVVFSYFLLQSYICYDPTVGRQANRRIPVSHKYPPLGIEPGSLITGSRRVNRWTSGTVYECSEIAGSAHYT
jgi:hypothetical protein